MNRHSIRCKLLRVMGNKSCTSSTDKESVIEDYPGDNPDSEVEEVLDGLCDQKEIIECGPENESVRIDADEIDDLWSYIDQECGDATKSIFRPIYDNLKC